MKIFFALFLAVLSHQEYVNPGYKGAVTQKGIAYSIEQITPYVKNFLADFEYIYPEFIYQEMDTPIGKIYVNITNVVVSNVTFDTINFQILEEEVGFSVKSGYAFVKYNWWFKKTSFPKSEKSGPGTASAKVDFSMNAGVKIEPAKSGKFVVKCDGASLNFQSLEINLSGAPTWLKTILSFLKSTIEKQVSEMVEKTLPDTIVEKGDEFLNEYSFTQDIEIPDIESKTKTVTVDFHIDDLVWKKSDLLGFALVGELFSNGFKKYHEIQSAHDLPDFETTGSHYIQAWVDEFILNAASYTLHNEGLIAVLLTQKNVPEEWPLKLSTTYFKDIIPEMYAKYPDKDMEILVTSSNYPKFNVKQNGIDTQIDMFGYVKVVENGLLDIFEFEIVLDSITKGMLKYNNVTFSLDVSNVKVTLVKSEIGTFDFSKFENYVKSLTNDYVVKYINKIGEVGIEIPYLKDYGIMFSNAEVNYNEIGYVEFLTDLDIHPPKLLSRFMQVMNRMEKN